MTGGTMRGGPIKSVFVVTALIFAFLGGIWFHAVYNRNVDFKIDTSELDSLQGRFHTLQRMYNGEAEKLENASRKFDSLKLTLQDTLNNYRIKIKYYEKERTVVADMSENDLLDSIANYYHKRSR